MDYLSVTGLKGVTQLFPDHLDDEADLSFLTGASDVEDEDRDHPTVKGRALPSSEVPKLMVKQRALSEATNEFLGTRAPSAQDVYRILAQGHNKQAAAQPLGIALSTVYKILRRGEAPRKRQYLG